MQLYKATIKLESSLVTPLKGDTIWGHVVWGIANHEGDEAVAKFLEDCKTSEPAFIVSSAFPKGTICKPFPQHEPRKLDMKTGDYAQIKKNKKIKYVSAGEYIKEITGTDNTAFKFEKVQIMHNAIDRFSNTVEEGTLFAVQELWAKQSEFDLYILSSYDINRVKELLDWAFENGYGADASTGKGKITVLGVKAAETKQKSTKYVALAPFVMDFSNIKEDSLRADTFIRTGKIGGAFASVISPYKKTVVLFDEGAVFETEEPVQFIGNLITDVHSDSRICQAGFAPVIPIGE